MFLTHLMSSISNMSRAEAKLVVFPIYSPLSLGFIVITMATQIWYNHLQNGSSHKYPICVQCEQSLNLWFLEQWCKMNELQMSLSVFVPFFLLPPIFAFSFQFLFRPLPAAKPSTPISSRISSSSLGCHYRSLSMRPIWPAASHPPSTIWAVTGKHTITSDLHVLTI